MSNSTKGRVQRGSAPARVLTDANYRKYALPALKRDFKDRCAYSLQHQRRAGGSPMSMEIDHFDPTIKGRDRHCYENLFLSTRYCNNKKHGNWPTDEQQARGVRFLNCCNEVDYGEHIFEDPDTYELVGVTPEGRYQIRTLDLNAAHFVDERRLRTQIRQLLFEEHKIVKESDAAIRVFHILKTELNYLIPPIEPPPAG
jgi:HNH endonuclease